MVEFAGKRFLLPPPASRFIPLFCSRPYDFLDELVRKRVLHKLNDIKEHDIERYLELRSFSAIWIFFYLTLKSKGNPTKNLKKDEVSSLYLS